ncbi:MAG TPA: hypothetical protein VGC79_01960, partial [Polyangiaceae bacterium]
MRFATPNAFSFVLGLAWFAAACSSDAPGSGEQNPALGGAENAAGSAGDAPDTAGAAGKRTTGGGTGGAGAGAGASARAGASAG